MKKAIIIIITATFGLFWAEPAKAALITIAIEATVDYVRDEYNYLEGQISPGDIITGTYTYESTTPDSSASQSIGRYEHCISPAGMFLNIGGIDGFDFRTNPEDVDFLIEITNDYPPNDDYFLLSHYNLPLSNGIQVGSISWWLYDPTGNALSSTNLPTTAPVIDHWQSNHLQLQTDRTFTINGHVTSAVIIPEPGTVCLLLLGTLLLPKTRHFLI